MADFEKQREQYLISTDKSKLQIERIHRFLSEESYWALKISKAVITKAIANSLCFGLYHDGLQIGFARVVSDYTSFAWICDVYVETAFRGQGLAVWLAQTIVSYPELNNLRRICLTTKDAHGVYEKAGFKMSATPNYWMEIKDADVYERLAKEVTNRE